MDMKFKSTDIGLYEKLLSLEKKNKYSDIISTDPKLDIINIKHNLDLSYAKSDYISQHKSGEKLTLKLNKFGIIQRNSIMPDHYIDHLLNCSHEDNNELLEFIDIFLPRLTKLKYKSWKKKKPYLHNKKNNYSGSYKQIISGMCGFTNITSKTDTQVTTKTRNSALLINRNKTCHNLKKILEGMYKCNITIIQNSGQWVTACTNNRSRIGNATSSYNQLGVNLIIGNKTWDIKHNIIIKIGPLDLSNYMSFLPSNKNHKLIATFLSYYLPNNIQYKLDLTLDKNYITPIKLQSESSHKLGINSWLVTRACELNKQDLTLGDNHE